VTRDIYAERCACGAKLRAADQMLARAYDHVELPPIKPVTTRILFQRKTGKAVRAKSQPDRDAHRAPRPH
jgi:hypothetical protein